MKKKILNALLMGVLVMTSMSVFVSCSDDYDDDIDDLRVEQADLLSKLTSLQSSVDSQASSINGQITSLQSSISSLSSDLQGAISDATQAAQAAGAATTAAATAQSTADGAATAAAAAQATADDALEKAQEALRKASDTAAGDALTKAESALTQLTELNNKLGSLETLDNGIAGLVEQVNKATKETLPELKEQVEKYQACFDNLFAMVTSVELYGKFTGTETQLIKTTDNFDVLDLLYGKITEDSKFGDNESYKALDTNQQISYSKNTDIRQTSTGIILRINPVNAKLSTEDANCRIKLMNSQAEDLDDYIEVVSVKPYEDLITGKKTETRAVENNGLWEVALRLKKDVDIKAFINAVVKGERTTNTDKSVTTEYKLFAVAVNNTDTTKADRYVASTFGLGLDSVNYVPSKNLAFTVTNNHNVTYGTSKGKIGGVESKEVIQNRYGYSYKKDGQTVSVPEYDWYKDNNNGDNNSDLPTPATAIKYNSNGSVLNVIVADGQNGTTNDDRSDDAATPGQLLPVDVNGNFTIALDNTGDMIDYYYVVLDKNFAEQESSPSEWNVWSELYTTEGLYETVKASEKKTLKVTTPSANGDIIGYRIFAVNYDGTLVDPDGKAFYVKVGQTAGEASASATITAGKNSNTSKPVALNGSFNAFTADGSDYTVEAAVINKDNSSDFQSGATFSFELWKDANGTQSATNWEDAKYVTISTSTPGKLQDEGTFEVYWRAKNGDRYINTLTVTVKKEMPTDTPELTFKTGQVVDGVYKCFVTPDKNDVTEGWDDNAENGYMNLKNVLNGLDNNDNWTWTFENAQWNSDKEVDEAYKVGYGQDTPISYDVTIAQKYIDNKTHHATKAVYTYTGISSYDKDNNLKWNQDFEVRTDEGDVETVFCCPLEPDVMSFAWTQRNAGTTAKPNMKDVNYIIYGSENGAATDQVATGVDLTQYLAITSSYDKTNFSGTWATYYERFSLEDDDVDIVSATLTSDENGKADYYTVKVGADGKFTFLPVPSSSNPKKDVKSWLNITTKDAFGHINTWSLPFTVKMR